MINVQGLNKFYNHGKSNEIHVINNVSLSLPDTGLITFLGKSGSGKTTLLNVIGGLDKATGTITYDDTTINNYKMGKVDAYRKEHIGYVFQNYNLLTDKSVYQNLEIALESVNITASDEVQKRIEYCLKAVGMYKFRKKPAFALSGGQMQRVSIARALVKNSKVIIADEPTGNLDSENSVEIMNILRKISKSSLVLLVTHDRQLAEFYSDSIIEIVDGKVENVRETEKGASIGSRMGDNTVYLKDMQCFDGQTDKVKYRIFTDDGECENLELTFVKKNNQLFLQANQKIKMVQDSHLELIDDHYKEVQIDEVDDDFNYDTSFFSDKKSSNFLKRIWLNIKEAVGNYFSGRKRSKFFHFTFLLIGALIAFLNVSYVNYSRIDDSQFGYDKDIYGIVDYEKKFYAGELGSSYGESGSYSELIREAMKEGLIDCFQIDDFQNFAFSITLSSFDSREIELNYMCLNLDIIKNDQIILGKFPEQRGEVVVSSLLADRIIKKLGISSADYSFLLNKTIECNDLDSVIVGIVKKDSQAVYYDKLLNSTDDYCTDYYLSDDEGKISNNWVRVVKKSAINYSIVDGRDIAADFEALASENSNMKIGDKLGEITIVGIYSVGDTLIWNNQFETDSLFITKDTTVKYIEWDSDRQYSQPYLFSQNITKLKEFFKDNDFTLLNSYDLQYTEMLEINKESRFILAPIMLILTLICLIYIYFSMRSKMIGDIYTIGVYRALGFSRFRIILKYVCEILVISFFTSILGYLLVSLGYQALAVSISKIGFSTARVFDWYSTYVMLFGMIFLNVVIGLLPIVMLMRKTPSEIIAKYDI